MLTAFVALADEMPLVVARLPTQDNRAHVTDAVCALRFPGVDVSLDGKRCIFGFADPASEPLIVTQRDGAIVFEGRLDPELVRSARTSVQTKLELGGEDYHAGTWVVSTWHRRSDALRNLGIVTITLSAMTLFAASQLALAAYLTDNPICGFSFNSTCGPRDSTSLWIGTSIALATGTALLTLGVVAYKAGKMKVALVPTGARVTF